MLFATEHVNAVSAKSADALGTRITFFEHTGPFTSGAVDLDAGSKSRGCTGFRRKTSGGNVEIPSGTLR